MYLKKIGFQMICLLFYFILLIIIFNMNGIISPHVERNGIHSLGISTANALSPYVFSDKLW